MTAATILMLASTAYALTQPVGMTNGDPAPIVLEDLTPSELLPIYNLAASILNRGRVGRFSDKATAVRRTWAILQDHQAWLEADDDAPAPTPTPAPEPTPAPTPAPADKAKREGKKRGMRFVFPAETAQKPVRPDSARGKALKLLLRKEGATFEEVQKATGWNEKQAYEGIRLVHYYSGYGLAEDVRGGKTFIRAHTGKK